VIVALTGGSVALAQVDLGQKQVGAMVRVTGMERVMVMVTGLLWVADLSWVMVRVRVKKRVGVTVRVVGWGVGLQWVMVNVMVLVMVMG
jgi:hypothetical protein